MNQLFENHDAPQHAIANPEVSTQRSLWKGIATIDHDIGAGHVTTGVACQEHVRLRKISNFCRVVWKEICLTLFNSAASQIRLPGIMSNHFAYNSFGCMDSTRSRVSLRQGMNSQVTLAFGLDESR